MGDVTLVLHVSDERPNAPGYQRLLDRLNAAALDALTKAGRRPELLATLDADPDDILARVRAADAVVLMGGEDVDPRLYGGVTEYPGSGTHATSADHVMIAAVREAVRAGIPLLGVCRGNQVINVALGGTLIPHLDGHRTRRDEPFVHTRVAVAAGESPAFDVGGSARCSHHQAVDRLGAGLRVVARAEDGTIEAIAHESAPIVGVQWHPEHPDVAATQLVALLDVVAPVDDVTRSGRPRRTRG